MQNKRARDHVQKAKLDYRNAPDPSFGALGPRTRLELLTFRALHGELP